MKYLCLNCHTDLHLDLSPEAVRRGATHCARRYLNFCEFYQHRTRPARRAYPDERTNCAGEFLGAACPWTPADTCPIHNTNERTAMTDTVTGRVIATKCHGNTYWGNPIVSVRLDTDPTGWLRISDNAGLVYGIDNPEYRNNPHTFQLTRSGRLSGYACPAEEI